MLTAADFDGEGEWQAYLEATRVFRRAELVLATGWTFNELDAQPRSEVNRFITYLSKKRALEHEQESMGSG